LINKVADIVHTNVDRYGGAVNKNMGEAFLLVWKFKSKDIYVN
jgi:class 3 adenylate cyclase